MKYSSFTSSVILEKYFLKINRKFGWKRGHALSSLSALLKPLSRASRVPQTNCNFLFCCIFYSKKKYHRKHCKRVFRKTHRLVKPLLRRLSLGTGQWSDSVFFLDLSQKLMESAHPCIVCEADKSQTSVLDASGGRWEKGHLENVLNKQFLGVSLRSQVQAMRAFSVWNIPAFLWTQELAREVPSQKKELTMHKCFWESIREQFL